MVPREWLCFLVDVFRGIDKRHGACVVKLPLNVDIKGFVFYVVGGVEPFSPSATETDFFSP